MQPVLLDYMLPVTLVEWPDIGMLSIKLKTTKDKWRVITQLDFCKILRQGAENFVSLTKATIQESILISGSLFKFWDVGLGRETFRTNF